MNGERDREITSYTTETVSSIYSYVFPYRGIGEGVGTIGSWKNVACAIHATMAPAFVHQHAPQIHLQHALHVRETHRRINSPT